MKKLVPYLGVFILGVWLGPIITKIELDRWLIIWIIFIVIMWMGERIHREGDKIDREHKAQEFAEKNGGKND